MRATWTFLLPLVAWTACGGGGDKESTEALNRRVTSLERRLGDVEDKLAGGKAEPAAPAAAEKPADEKRHGDHKGGKDGVAVTAEGDAQQVVLRHKQKTAPLPAEIPPGTYTWEATFADGGAPVSGSITLVAGTPAAVVCTAATRSCVTR